ncbi:MAG: DUF2807 domain-containing protein [Bacteroidales bacterium]|nr:DUF2807 domain-containing protein [Bacteroidales bacterium]
MNWFLKYATLLMILAMVVSSCEKIIFSDNGELVRLETEFESFSQISFYDIFDVEIAVDTVFSVSVETDEEFLDQISVTLDSGNLILNDHNVLKILTDYPRPFVRITLPYLNDHILLKAPVRITSSDTLRIPKLRIVSLGKAADIDLCIDTDHFQITTGSDNFGFYRVRGYSDNSRLWPRGSSIFDASELETKNCYVFNNSIGDCTVNVRGTLEAGLDRAGNIYYYGRPEEIVILEESGTGKLIQVDD